MDLKKTGELISESRKALGMTQKELADTIGVTDKAVSRWETGRGFPDAAYLQPLAQALGVSITELVNGELTQPEIAAKQADDALLSALEYGKKMAKTVLSVFLTIAGVAVLLSPWFWVGKVADYLPIAAVFLLAGAAALKFWKRGPSPKLAQILALTEMLIALVLQALPISAVLVFQGPDYYNRNLYSCFDLTLWGYANFSPTLSALLTVAVLIMLVILLLNRKPDLRNKAFICTILAAVLMILPVLLMGGEYMTPAALAVVLLQLTAAFLQAWANGAGERKDG